MSSGIDSFTQTTARPQSAGSPDIKAYLYENVSQVSTYTRDLGLLTLPVAGPDGSPARIIKTHAVMGYRSFNFNESKRGSPPMFPMMQDTSSGDKLLGGSLSFPLPGLNGDQSGYDYAVSGSYLYLQDGPLLSGDTSNYPNSQSRNFNPNSPTSSYSSSTTMYGPRGNYSQYQTGRYPFVPYLINGYIQFGNGNIDAPGVPENPGLANVPWAFVTPQTPQAGEPKYTPLPVTGSTAASSINLTDASYTYWDTAIGPAFFSPSIIG